MSETNNPWIEVASCAFLHEAELLKSVLENAGIEAILPDEHTLGVDPGLTPAFGGVRVFVRAEYLDRARDVIASRP
jgi:hypothetical protein